MGKGFSDKELDMDKCSKNNGLSIKFQVTPEVLKTDRWTDKLTELYFLPADLNIRLFWVIMMFIQRGEEKSNFYPFPGGEATIFGFILKFIHITVSDKICKLSISRWGNANQLFLNP